METKTCLFMSFRGQEKKEKTPQIVEFAGFDCVLSAFAEFFRLLKSPFVVPPGFEPRLTEPKSGVLPLHHGTIPVCAFCSKAVQIYNPFLFFQNKFSKIFILNYIFIT